MAKLAPMELSPAVRLLVAEAELDADDDTTRAIAELVGREAPALSFAAGLARARGWRPLREKLATWEGFATLVRGNALPWQVDVDAAIAALAPETVEVVKVLAACDAPMTWELVEARLGVERVTIEMVCDLEDDGLLLRSTRAGVVMFTTPFCVRAALRMRFADEMKEHATGWLSAWLARANELRASTYGSSARATLSELACAIPVAERALLSDPTSPVAAALWIAISDAMFFERAADYASPAFALAVAAADASGDLEGRVRARLASARALLERGEPEHAEVLLTEARKLAEGAADALVSEALRGSGWAALASARMDDAKTFFERAHDIGERARDPRARADAFAGLGMAALLGGDTEQARERLTVSLAIHVVTRDAPRESALRGMMMLLPESRANEADAAALAAQVEELRGAGQRWREALALARLALVARERGDEGTAKARLAEARAAAALSTMSASKLAFAMVDEPAAGAPSTARGMVVGPEGRWLVLEDGTRHELARHGPVRRMLWSLAIAKTERPGHAMTTLELVEAGWPGEKMRHEAATLRVYTTVRRLRALGLGDILLTRDDGYLFDPETTITLERA